MFFNKPGNAQFPLEGTRRPMYAGSWYEADGEKLKEQLSAFLASADPVVDAGSAALLTSVNQPPGRPVLAIVVPHAGYAFSGKAAAYAYKAAQGQRVKRIFLLGPSHYIGFHGAALPMAVTFATPLGDLEVDKEVVAELKEYPIFHKLPEVHRLEHSLEIQLPFIKQAFGDVKIVPIVIGTLTDDTEVRLLAEILKGYIASDDLVVVSSDFTHYGPRYDYRPFKDNIRGNIRKLDSEAYGYLSQLDLDGFLKFQHDTGDTICGFFPCSVLTAILPQGTRSSLLKYYTSQDTTVEDKDNSVSYMAIAFSGGSWPQDPQAKMKAREAVKLTVDEKKALLRLARATVDSYVRERKKPTPEELGLTLTPGLKQVLGAFVTLNKYGGSTGGASGGSVSPASERKGDESRQKEHSYASIEDGHGPRKNDGRELRGCIGYIWPLKPLYQAVIDNAVTACTADYRFYSVKPEELEHIRIEISVLTPPRRINSYNDIVLGRDGIVLFKDGHQSVFLPFVATQFGWDLPTTLSELSRKAGLNANDWRDGAKFDVFQADVFEERL